MKSTILRILIGAVLSALLSGLVVSIIGLPQAWKTSTQFSHGFFWAGVVMVLIGLVSLVGSRQRAPDWPPVHVHPDDGAKIWAVDAFRGKIPVAVSGVSGLPLFGLSILVMRRFWMAAGKEHSSGNPRRIPAAGGRFGAHSIAGFLILQDGFNRL